MRNWRSPLFPLASSQLTVCRQFSPLRERPREPRVAGWGLEGGVPEGGRGPPRVIRRCSRSKAPIPRQASSHLMTCYGSGVPCRGCDRGQLCGHNRGLPSTSARVASRDQTISRYSDLPCPRPDQRGIRRARGSHLLDALTAKSKERDPLQRRRSNGYCLPCFQPPDTLSVESTMP